MNAVDPGHEPVSGISMRQPYRFSGGQLGRAVGWTLLWFNLAVPATTFVVIAGEPICDPADYSWSPTGAGLGWALDAAIISPIMAIPASCLIGLVVGLPLATLVNRRLGSNPRIGVHIAATTLLGASLGALPMLAFLAAEAGTNLAEGVGDSIADGAPLILLGAVVTAGATTLGWWQVARKLPDTPAAPFPSEN